MLNITAELGYKPLCEQWKGVLSFYSINGQIGFCDWKAVVNIVFDQANMLLQQHRGHENFKRSLSEFSQTAGVCVCLAGIQCQLQS